MSHTSTINTVQIKDISALRAAVRELQQKQGVNITLEEEAKPRAYFSNQAGMNEIAPYVVRLNDGPYDVGIYRNEETKSYEARFDDFGGYIAKELGVPVTESITREQAAVGKLYNLYSVHAAMRVAEANGQVVTRRNNADGSVTLTVDLQAA